LETQTQQPPTDDERTADARTVFEFGPVPLAYTSNGSTSLLGMLVIFMCGFSAFSAYVEHSIRHHPIGAIELALKSLLHYDVMTQAASVPLLLIVGIGLFARQEWGRVLALLLLGVKSI